MKIKTYAPRHLAGCQLREIMTDLGADAATVAKLLKVTERSVWRWLADDSAPYAALAALWHETPAGRRVTALDVGNEARHLAGERNALRSALDKADQRLARILAISDTGAANDPMAGLPALALREPPQAVALGLQGHFSAVCTG